MSKSKSHPCQHPFTALKGTFPNLTCKKCGKDLSPMEPMDFGPSIPNLVGE